MVMVLFPYGLNVVGHVMQEASAVLPQSVDAWQAFAHRISPEFGTRRRVIHRVCKLCIILKE